MERMVLSLSPLETFQFADGMYTLLFPDANERTGQTELVYKFVWKKIVDQQLRPGERVRDSAIAAAAGVSRTPVREAIQRLVQDGLLEELPRGVRVTHLTAADVEHLYEYRTVLEVYATRRAAAKIPEHDIRHLRDAGEQIRERLLAPGGQYDPHVAIARLRYDITLHQLLLHHGGNPYIMRAKASIQARLSVFQVGTTRFPTRLVEAIDDHEEILDCLARRDADAAGNAMEAHIQRVKYRILADFFGMPALQGPGIVGMDGSR